MSNSELVILNNSIYRNIELKGENMNMPKHSKPKPPDA